MTSEYTQLKAGSNLYLSLQLNIFVVQKETSCSVFVIVDSRRGANDIKTNIAAIYNISTIGKINYSLLLVTTEAKWRGLRTGCVKKYC